MKCVVCGKPAVTEWREYTEPSIWTCGVCYPEDKKKEMSITIMAPAYYPSMYPVRYLEKSAKRQGISVWWYGLGKPYHNWYDTQIIDLLEEIPKIPTSHILYTDGSDSILLTGMVQIEGKYSWLGRPPLLISRERSGLCAGGWIGEKAAVLDALLTLKDFAVVGDQDIWNPQVRWRQAVAWGQVLVESDQNCEIFQVADEPLNISHDGRVYNLRTGRGPAILHFAGGYTDPEIGKQEQIEPIWKALGYATTV